MKQYSKSPFILTSLIAIFVFLRLKMNSLYTHSFYKKIKNKNKNLIKINKIHIYYKIKMSRIEYKIILINKH